MAERSLREFYDCKRRIIFRHQCDPPPLIARDANYMSLWRSLSSSEQEKLRSLLEHLEPVDQDRLLRVKDEWMRSSWLLLFDTPKSELLNVLTRIHPAHRSYVLRQLEPLNQQERERLVNVLDVLKHSERVELLGILNEHGVLEQQTILKVMYDLCGPLRHSLFLFYSLKDTPNAMTVLSLLKGLHPLDRSKLVRLLERLDHIHQCKLLSALEGLDSQEQKRMLEIMSSLERQEQERLIKFLHRQEHSEWMKLLGILNEHDVLERRVILKVLDGLYGKSDPIWYHTLYSHFEDAPKAAAVLSLLKSLHPLDRLKLVRLLDGLDLTHQRALLSALEGLDFQKHRETIVMLNDLKPLGQRQLLTALVGLDSTPIYKLLARAYRLPKERWAYYMHLANSDTNRVYRPLLLEIILQLEPQEKHQLLWVLDKLPSTMRLEMLKGMYGLKLPEKKVLLRVLDSLGSLKGVQVLKVMCEYLKTGLLSLNGKSYMFKSAFKMPVLSLLERQQPLTRSSVEEYLDALDPLAEKQLLRALDRLDHQERKKIEIIKIFLQWKDYKSLLQRLVQLFVCLLSICLSEDSQRGGFRNLLLDGWWLEFWEIILLAAGDVERNPGPRRITAEELSNVDGQVLGKDDIFDVYDAVFDCRAKWNNLCLALRISPSDLSAVEEKRHGDMAACLRDGLSLWLQGCYDKVKYGPPTWRMLVDAVANSAGGDDHSLALEIAEEHRALPNVQIAISGCDDRGSSEEMGTVSFGDKHKTNKRTDAQSVMKPVEDWAREDSRHGHQHSAAFSKMYGAITRGIGRSLDVDELKLFLRYYLCPHTPSRHYVEPGIYEDAESTRDILDCLCPVYVNSGNVYLLEEIVSLSNSRQCRRILDEYIRKYPL